MGNAEFKYIVLRWQVYSVSRNMPLELEISILRLPTFNCDDCLFILCNALSAMTMSW